MVLVFRIPNISHRILPSPFTKGDSVTHGVRSGSKSRGNRMDPSMKTNTNPLSPVELWYHLEQGFLEIDVMMKDLLLHQVRGPVAEHLMVAHD